MNTRRILLSLFSASLLFAGISCKDDRRDPISEEEIQVSEDSLEQDESELREAEESELAAEVANLIRVKTPLANSEIASPVTITGSARGPWYFEGDFPVWLYDENGRELAVAIAVAQGPWMTQEWVDFEAQMEFESPSPGTGYLVFQKSNPSDKRELDRSYRIKVSW